MNEDICNDVLNFSAIHRIGSFWHKILNKKICKVFFKHKCILQILKALSLSFYQSTFVKKGFSKLSRMLNENRTTCVNKYIMQDLAYNIAWCFIKVKWNKFLLNLSYSFQEVQLNKGTRDIWKNKTIKEEKEIARKLRENKK